MLSNQDEFRIEGQVVAVLWPLIEQGTAREKDIRAAVKSTLAMLVDEGFIDTEPAYIRHSE